jgi:exodeoxyribonuclease VII large subunit
MKEQIVLTVSQLTQAIKLQLEATFPHVLLKGEISNLKLQSSGHMYFSLKDEFAQIACVMFRQDLMKVQVPLKSGDQVVIRAELSVYPPKGGYQLIVKEISLVGLGEYLMKLELLKQKLNSMGYFAQERKKKLPAFPKKIGVVTSPTGAVIRDIINILTRRLKGFHLILNPVKVQGEGAADEIARAIEEFNTHKLVDVIIVCRGGGSVEDLMAFNDEKVAHAIFKSEIPIISAVGHETDISISDFVADIRAPTPSAAAEIVSFEMDELLSSLSKLRRQIQQIIVKNFLKTKESFTRITKHPLFTSPTALLGHAMQSLDSMKEMVDQSINRIFQLNCQRFLKLKRSAELARPSRRITENMNRLVQLEKALNISIMRKVNEKKQRLEDMNFESLIPELVTKEISQKRKELERLVSHLQSLNPKSLLAKGYSIIFSQKDGSVISSIQALKPQDSVQILLVDGKAKATITDILPQ